MGPRTHLSLEKDAPISRAVDRAGRILCRPTLGGLHHQYARINLRQAPAESLLVLQHVGGAVARIPLTDTPYANRDALFDCFPISIWDDPEKDVTHIRWARELWEAMQPFSTGGVYANNLGEEGTERIAAAYRENYARLLALKNKYHPTNFFRLNQNINPATEPIRGTQE